jgi:hypothetical protein
MAKDKPAATVHSTAAECVKACKDGLQAFVADHPKGTAYISAVGLHDARLAYLKHVQATVRAMKQSEQLDAMKAALTGDAG